LRFWISDSSLWSPSSTSSPTSVRGPAERDAVYILYHDGSETEELADDVSVFVGRVRKAVRGHS
jgi:hypothetical protein